MDKGQTAIECFKCGFNCAQSVFSSIAPDFGLEKETALKIAGPFGGGMGRMGETCGAVTGAFMAIGLLYSKSKDGEDALRDKGYQLVQKFSEQFKSKYGSIICRELLGCDIGTPEGKQRIAELNLFENLCAKLVRDAANITDELLHEQTVS